MSTGRPYPGYAELQSTHIPQRVFWRCCEEASSENVFNQRRIQTLPLGACKPPCKTDVCSLNGKQEEPGQVVRGTFPCGHWLQRSTCKSNDQIGVGPDDSRNRHDRMVSHRPRRMVCRADSCSIRPLPVFQLLLKTVHYRRQLSNRLDHFVSTGCT